MPEATLLVFLGLRLTAVAAALPFSRIMCMSSWGADFFCEHLDDPVVQRQAIIDGGVFDTSVQLIIKLDWKCFGHRYVFLARLFN